MTTPIKYFVYILTLFLIVSCRTSNRKLFEEFADINIPSSAKITTDEYKDMGPDYVKSFEIKLDQRSKADLQLSILKSKFFNSSIYSDHGTFESQQVLSDKKKGLWYRSKNGYLFRGSKNKGRDVIYITVDTLTMKANFEYLSD